MAVLFFDVMRREAEPAAMGNDCFILSKGHAAPLLYAALAEAGFIASSDLLSLRQIDSDLEGHPTPRAPFVRIATGSLGQGLSSGLGIALNAKRLDGSSKRVYVLMGDGESMEGAVWEAAAVASHYSLDNLCVVIDVNRLGQSEPTMLGHGLDAYERRWKAFGWNALIADGHDVTDLLERFTQAADHAGEPTVILARTTKGKGIPEWEDKNGYHGKPLDVHAAESVIRHPEPAEHQARSKPQAEEKPTTPRPAPSATSREFMRYQNGSESVATRRAFGEALAAAGEVNKDIVVLDGDVKNSTYTALFEERHPDRFFQMYIAEQNMIGAAMGLASEGRIPFAASFACFLSRGYDFARMAAIGGNNIKLAGSHAGVSIGEDGPSQMGLEDIALFCAQPSFKVLYPSDAVSTWEAVRLAIETDGPVYIRTTRPKTPVIYAPESKFGLGQSKVVRQSDADVITIVAGGITLFEALEAYERLSRDGIAARVVDLFSVQPIDEETLGACAEKTAGRFVVVEDHYVHGGIGDAVSAAVARYRPQVVKLAVRGIPRSGKGPELMERYGITAGHIVTAVTQLL